MKKSTCLHHLSTDELIVNETSMRIYLRFFCSTFNRTKNEVISSIRGETQSSDPSQNYVLGKVYKQLYMWQQEYSFVQRPIAEVHCTSKSGIKLEPIQTLFSVWMKVHVIENVLVGIASSSWRYDTEETDFVLFFFCTEKDEKQRVL